MHNASWSRVKVPGVNRIASTLSLLSFVVPGFPPDSVLYATNLVDLAQVAGNARKLHIIDAGHCGTVWVPYRPGPVFKLEKTGTGRTLENGYQKHEKRTYSCWKSPKIPRSQVPDCNDFISRLQTKDGCLLS